MYWCGGGEDKGYKLDRVDPLIADPPLANSTTIHSRLVRQNINLFLEGKTLFARSKKTP